MRLFSFIYFESERIERHLRLQAHFQRLISLLPGKSADSVFRKIGAGSLVGEKIFGMPCKIAYCLGHTDPERGFETAPGRYLGPQAFMDGFPRNPLTCPAMVYLNTCDSMTAGLVEVLLARGIRCVVFSPEKIAIKGMGLAAEDFFRTWIQGRCSVRETIAHLRDDAKTRITLHAIGTGASLTYAET